jgi:hypothetical protein
MARTVPFRKKSIVFNEVTFPITHFWKAICMRSNDGDISRTWRRITEWDILFDFQVLSDFLLSCSGLGVFSYMLAGDFVFRDGEQVRFHLEPLRRG